MNLVKLIKSLIWPERQRKPAEIDAFDVEAFIYVKIPGQIGPIERGELFEDRIDPVLAERGLGAVSGGGTSLGNVRPDGSRPIEFCGIDIDTNDPDEARAALRELLPTLNAPIGTELHYMTNGRKLKDEFTSDGWLLERERAFVHPGFAT